MTIQAARRIAQEESFGNSAIVRELNMAEILTRAEDARRLDSEQVARQFETQQRDAEEALARARSEADERLKERERTAGVELMRAVADAQQLARSEALAERDAANRKRATNLAWWVVAALRFLLFVAFIPLLLVAQWQPSSAQSLLSLANVATVFLGLINIASVADLLGLPLLRPLFSRMERVFSEWIYRRLLT